jgi:hypothetical protein
MTSRSSRTLLVAFLFLHGLVSLAGPALHALPGFNHHRAELARHDDATPGSGSTDLGRGATDDCQVCHLHYQGLFQVDADSRLQVDVVRIRPTAEEPLVLPSAPRASSSPRAPPLA